MLTLLFRKMRNTKWMVLCLLVGFVMASAMMSTVPIYMNASLQRMLTKDMEAFQLENDVYPGIYTVEQAMVFGLTPDSQRLSISSVESVVNSRFGDLEVPMLNSKSVMIDQYLYAKSIEVLPGTSASRLHLGAMDGIADHINIVQGEMFEAGLQNGVYEVIGTELALKTSKLTLGSEYDIANVFDTELSVRIKIVGIYEPSSANDTYWSEGTDSYLNTFFMDRETLLGEVIDSGAVSITNCSYRYVIDYPNMDMTGFSATTQTINAQLKQYSQEKLTLNVPAKEIFEEYSVRSAQLKLVLWLLQIPVMLMLVFYLFMVSQLNVEQEKNEIAVFKSRGASRGQIFAVYGLESLILGVASAVIGPFAGLGLCKILGVSNGFLEFVNRPALPAKLSLEAFVYALIAVAVFFITTMVPIIPATKTSIVEHKQRKAKKTKKSFWEKCGLDFILILGSVGWLYFYNYQQERLIEQGITDTTTAINPIMFVASTAFILGAGMLFLRVYPFVLRIVYSAGKKVWSPSAYVSLNNVGRSSTGREKFLMLFLILTVSLGLFSANTARALNRSSEERIRYDIGCDVLIEEMWLNSNMGSTQAPDGTMVQNVLDEEDTSTVQYIEPVFERYEKLSGVTNATKVFRRENIMVRSNVGEEVTSKGVELMTVIPSEFADIAWSTNDLLPVHLNEYLNALAEYPSGVILSSNFKNYGIELGDVVSVKWSKNSYFDATVLAFVDCWPAINPYEKNENGDYIEFAVMNFDYVRMQTASEPYQVWLSLEENASVQALYDSISESDIVPTTLRVSSQELVTAKNDPMLQGMNGALTMGFIIIMVMCIIGFLIYWILSIKSRTLQFGILRAMGMSFGEIIAMLFYEQIMTSAVSIVVAIVFGGIASELFVPLFQSIYSATEQIPAFKVVPVRSDYLKLYIIIGLMLLVCFAVLGRLISKIKINQALKLGED